MPLESTRMDPNEVWLTWMAVPAAWAGADVDPVTGTTAVGAVEGAAAGALVAVGAEVAVAGMGVAGAQADRISTSMATPVNNIFVFIRSSDLVQVYMCLSNLICRGI